MKSLWCSILIILLAAAGCGTSKWTDTGRSATEQLLITDAMDRAVSDLDFRALAGKTCFIDSNAIRRVTDWEYLVSCLRQHMLANGCLVMDGKVDAAYIVEVRAGAVGTDRHDVLYGVPAVNIPTIVPVSGFGIPPQIPEMPIVKKTDQRAIVKLSLFAYNRETGRPVWQSGAVPEESDAKAIWILGAGPFQRGTIFNGMEFAGDEIDIPLVDLYHPNNDHISVADEAYFVEPEEKSAEELATSTEPTEEQPQSAAVVPAAHAEPAASPPPAAAPSPAPAAPGPAPPAPAEPATPAETVAQPEALPVQAEQPLPSTSPAPSGGLPPVSAGAPSSASKSSNPQGSDSNSLPPLEPFIPRPVLAIPDRSDW